MLQLLLMMGFPMPLALQTAIGGVEEGAGPGLEDELACQDAYVFLNPAELNFTYSGDVEGAEVIGYSRMGSSAVEVVLEITDMNEGQSFSFLDFPAHCDGTEDEDPMGGGRTCVLSVEAENWPVVPIVFQVDVNNTNATHVGWLAVYWYDEAGNRCEAGQSMLDGHIE